jgi:hypothetical protein
LSHAGGSRRCRGRPEELTAEASASRGKVLLAALNKLYGQPSVVR